MSGLHGRLIALPRLCVIGDQDVLNLAHGGAQVSHLLVKLRGLQDSTQGGQLLVQLQPCECVGAETAAFVQMSKQRIGVGNGRFSLVIQTLIGYLSGYPESRPCAYLADLVRRGGGEGSPHRRRLLPPAAGGVGEPGARFDDRHALGHGRRTG